MENISAAGTSAAREPAGKTVPPCVSTRARELLDLAILKLLALSLGVNAALQIVALWVALLSAPHLHYIPEVG
jgi:hypothetical protein